MMETYRKEDIRRGDIYYADLRPVVGSEQGGIRPVVILQNNVGNRHSPTVIAAAITSRKGKHKLPTVAYILTNISYTGDMIWQKSCATDTIPFRQVRNLGQKPRYFVEHSHPAIVSCADFQRVQELMSSRKGQFHGTHRISKGSRYDKHIYCGGCGSLCRKKITGGKTYWVCRRHDGNKADCPIPKRSKGVCLMNIQKTAPTPKLVTMIPADPQMTERDLRKKHLRVAPYCRVSTDKEEQLSSYEAQIEYYTEKIDANPDWTMVRLYADEGITGTSAKKRKDFLQMIRDCERGKIDLVITKSVSRFCRNTLDGLNYVRRLKRHGVGVYFEKENVNTLFMDNEMILTFMMSQAQAESESLSGNVRWGHRKNFKDGKVYYHCKTFLGYRWGADGQPEIDPEQAAIVRRIFSRFLLGHSVRQITTDLMADGIKTATGKTVWHDSVVQKMLCNEKYIGDAILQKTYIADLFTREKRVNNGELPKYYVHDCHPAIIDRETFQKVQEELARRSSLKKTSSKAKTQLGKYCGKYVLSELLVCGECGSPYRRVIWTQKGVKRVVWRCQNRLEHGRKICKQSPTLDEGDIHDAVISAMNELFRMQAAKDAVKAGIAAVLAGEEQTMSLPAVELQIRNLQERQLELFQLIVSAGADCTDYDEELQQVNIAKTRLMAQKAELEKEQRGAAAFESRLAELDMALEQASGTLTDFDELTVRQLVSNIKVLDKDSLLICFKDGTEITQAMQRRQAA